MKKRIIFVDDEINVLQGLRRMLRSMRNEWDMAFVESGQKALGLMQESPFDVIVSDMRMPGMDGVSLLKKVKECYPKVIRIILSGQSDKEFIMKSVRLTHQYLSKPCEAESVRATVERACALQGLLSQNALKSIVSQVDSLPSIPSIYTEIMEELNSTDVSIKRIGEIVSKDLGMTTKVLQIVNSAFFGIPRHIEHPTQAVSLLGTETIKALVLTIEVFSKFNQKKIPYFSLEKLWQHCMSTGTIAKRIACEENASKEVIDEAFFAGLLHDIGKLILVSNLPDKYLEVQNLAYGENLLFHTAEQKILGSTHAELGAYLLGLWGLPDSIIEAVAFHHSPRECHANSFGILAAVHLANAIEYSEMDQKEGKTAKQKYDFVFLEELDLIQKLGNSVDI